MVRQQSLFRKIRDCVHPWVLDCGSPPCKCFNHGKTAEWSHQRIVAPLMHSDDPRFAHFFSQIHHLSRQLAICPGVQELAAKGVHRSGVKSARNHDEIRLKTADRRHYDTLERAQVGPSARPCG
ncbi:hypothetical protein D3C81_1806130 [compost metagenome]